MKKQIWVLVALAVLSACTSTPLPIGKEPKRVSIIPQPVSIKEGVGEFTVTSRTVIAAMSEAAEAAAFLAEDFRIAAGFAPQTVAEAESNVIRFAAAGAELEGKGDEAYTLDVTVNAVEIRANGASGFFYGYQTLKQLLPSEIYAGMIQSGVAWTVPVVSIEDYPRFEWRGLMLDCARHFFEVSAVKEFIDLMAIHKFNRFHWHLTDDQGWRLEIKKYPLLTEVGSKREQTLRGHYNAGLKDGHKYDNKPHGGYYTQEDAREIVHYAAARGITVVPEIELPGHAQAAIAAYPWLGINDVPEAKLLSTKSDSSCLFNCPDCIQGNDVKVSGMWGVSPRLFKPSDKTIEFLKDVLTEVMEIFPGEVLHIGGDECERNGQWKHSPEVQAFIQERQLGNEDGVQRWFVNQLDEFLTERGRRLICWYENIDGDLSPNAIMMSWRGTSGGIRSAKMHHDIIMTPNNFCYLDYHQESAPYNQLGIGSHLPLEKVYSFEPIGKALAGEYEKYVLGGQGNLWAEYIKSIEQIEYMLFPRAAAVSEVFWSPKSEKSFPFFRRKLKDHLQRLAAFDVKFCVPSKARKVTSVSVEEVGDAEALLSGLEGATTVQVYLVPSKGSALDAEIPNAQLSFDSNIAFAERPECCIFEGVAQSAVFTFHLKEPIVDDEARLTLSAAAVSKPGAVDVYVKLIDAEGNCR